MTLRRGSVARETLTNRDDESLQDLIDSIDEAQAIFEAMSHADGRLALIFDRRKGCARQTC